MNRQKLAVVQVQVIDRQRQDMGDLESLAESIKRYGVIQPIVLDQNKRLIAGGRRLAACKLLNLETIDVVYRETLTEDELFCLELEENLQRKQETWQEETLSVAKIHYIKKQIAAVDGQSWGQVQTARMLGLKSHCNVNYALKVAERLANKEDVLWKCESLFDAWQTIQEEEISRYDKEIAERQIAEGQQIKVTEEEHPFADLFEQVDSNILETPNEGVNSEILLLRNTPYDELSLEQAKQVYLSNELNPPDKFEEYYAYKMRQFEARNTVDLSNILVHGDSITFMNDPKNASRFDHIITDIPYGIDMDMLSQENTGMDIESTRAEHDIDYNMQLIEDFFPAAFACTNDIAFVITWCDAMLFSGMVELAKAAGFAVQRWPFHWIKGHAGNQAAQYNQTKATEIAIICRKPGATRVVTTGLNYEICDKDELCELIDHPFAKPERLWHRLADEVSIAGQTILEPFMGRGSGVVSLLKLNRNVVGVELNEAHYNAARLNVQNLHFLRMNPKLKFV